MRRLFKIYIIAFFTAAVTGHLTVSSHASDASHTCASAGGYFNIINEELRAGNKNAIPYEIITRRVLRNQRGFCISNLSPKKPYAFEMRTYVMLIKFRYQNRDMTVDFICEDVSDGLPAALNCDKERITLDSKNY